MSNPESHLSVMGFTLLSDYLILQNKDSMSQDIWIVGFFNLWNPRTGQLSSSLTLRGGSKDDQIKNTLGLKQSPEKREWSHCNNSNLFPYSSVLFQELKGMYEYIHITSSIVYTLVWPQHLKKKSRDFAVPCQTFAL